MSSNATFSEDQRDYLQEICNIGMGQAGESLSILLDQYVILTIPSIQIFQADNISDELSKLIPEKAISAVRQGFYSKLGPQQFSGEAITIFNTTAVEDIASLIDFDEELTDAAQKELLLEISNIINGACLSGIAQQFSEQLGHSAPSILGLNIPVENLLVKSQLQWDCALSIKIGYSVKNHNFQCLVLLLLPDSSIQYIKTVLDKLLEELG